MSRDIQFTLDPDEREVINCLIEKSLQKQKILKYAKGHGVTIRDGTPFEYDKATGIVTVKDGCSYGPADKY